MSIKSTEKTAKQKKKKILLNTNVCLKAHNKMEMLESIETKLIN